MVFVQDKLQLQQLTYERDIGVIRTDSKAVSEEHDNFKQR